ncbi:hypothetical protein [Sinomonas gamaensis]|jgi:hypothetical protein|nr:hypothetical protein [Sinomonas gamaensis]
MTHGIDDSRLQDLTGPDDGRDREASAADSQDLEDEEPNPDIDLGYD